MPDSSFVELLVSSNFSFLRGASHPEEYITAAHSLSYPYAALSDLETFGGIVRAAKAARECCIPLLSGTRLRLYDDSCTFLVCTVIAYPTNATGYAALCGLISRGKQKSESKEYALIALSEFLSAFKDMVVIYLPRCFASEFFELKLPSAQHTRQSSDAVAVSEREVLALCKEAATSSEALSLALVQHYSLQQAQALKACRALARDFDIAEIASNNVYYHCPKRRALCDVLQCIRERTTLGAAGYRLFPNGERYLKSAQEMSRLFREIPSAVARTLTVAEAASGFSLKQLRYEYPNEVVPANKDAAQYLRECTSAGARERYPGGVPRKVQQLIEEELRLISELRYEKYFLTCYDIVRFAREQGILCQGRGAAANSAVCYVLGITNVNPQELDLLFARFVSKERNEPPDIDIDFEHERREEVIQYIYERYGRERAALTATVVCFRSRSALREVATAFGFSSNVTDALAQCIHRWTAHAVSDAELREVGLDPHSQHLQDVFALATQLKGFPRHLSQHVGGFIISERPLTSMVPILPAAMEGRSTIEWDKDDIEELGILKIDVLALGMLTCIRKALEYINARHDSKEFLELHRIPQDDSQVYDMICCADTVGIFQIESRAQMSMLPRLRPRCYYDLVIQVAIVRPGPIQGNMVHPFLRRRKGLEKPHYPDKSVASILAKTLGVPIFQEQAMRLAITLAGFSPGEAEALRRAMAAWKRNTNLIAHFTSRIIKGMVQRGYNEGFAQSVMQQIKGFSEYGFPESHAASFAHLVYASAWIKHHYPAEFAAALLNSQPMGFYSPSQIVQDARRHGVCIHALCIDTSRKDSFCHWQVLQKRYDVRLGFRMAKGVSELQALLLEKLLRDFGPFYTLEELWKARCQNCVALSKRTLLALARADAFHSLGISRRDALWKLAKLPESYGALEQLLPVVNSHAHLPAMSTQLSMFQDYEHTGLSLRAHPIEFIRARLEHQRVVTAVNFHNTAETLRNKRLRVAGLSTCKQRPGTAKGVVFITLEDETGSVNLIIRPAIFERFSKVVLQSSSLLVEGIVDYADGVRYLLPDLLISLDSAVLSAQRVSHSEYRDPRTPSKLKPRHIPVKSYSY